MLENQGLANVKRRSQSATNMCPITGPCIDIVTNHEGPPTCRPKQSTSSLKVKDQTPCYREMCEQKPLYTSLKFQKPIENLVKKTPNTIDRSCTCCIRVNKTDAETQYELPAETFVSTSCEVCANTPQLQVPTQNLLL